ncbi:MAG: hypothetical protein M3271_03850, partial [Actinomycetota bacterium]|nr:hypothetical protein [Actinomycetota bacterium]
EEPPAPPPVCSDGIDNDGSGTTDYGSDGGCAAPRDPTEDSYQAPFCYDGIDNDADGTFDFPADAGCSDYGDGGEFLCPPPGRCTPEVRLTLRFSEETGRFFGEVQAPDPCIGDRRIRLYRRGEDRRLELVDRMRSDADGSWESRRLPVTEARFVAWVGQILRETETGDVVGCTWDRSRPISVPP